MRSPRPQLAVQPAMDLGSRFIRRESSASMAVYVAQNGRRRSDNPVCVMEFLLSRVLRQLRGVALVGIGP